MAHESMRGLKSFNIGLSCLLELAMLAALCYWGFKTGKTLGARVALGAGIPAIVMIFWSLWMAPNAKRRMKRIPGSATSLFLFLPASAFTAGTGHELTALVLAAQSVVNFVFKLAWKQS